ncbi:MAG: Ala-tRNA(Pro) deacylase, partial [Oceanicoccus sp.]
MDILSKLEDLQIAYELHSHEPFFTCEQADAVYAELEGGHSKNLFIRDRKGKQHYLIVLESYKRLDLKGLGQEMSKRFSFASPERLLKWLKVTPGSVSPLNLIFDTENHVKVLVDEDLFKH